MKKMVLRHLVMKFGEGCTGNTSSTGAWVWHYWDHLEHYSLILILSRCGLWWAMNRTDKRRVRQLVLWFSWPFFMSKYCTSRTLQVAEFDIFHKHVATISFGKVLVADLWWSLNSCWLFLEAKSLGFMGKLDFCRWKFVSAHLAPLPYKSQQNPPPVSFLLPKKPSSNWTKSLKNVCFLLSNKPSSNWTKSLKIAFDWM